MQSVPTDHQFLPHKDEERVICGVTIVEWDYAVVYVRNKQFSHDPPTHLYFQFIGSGDCYLDEMATLVDQWTHYRGVCNRIYGPGDHEYHRARKMAIKVVTTYRDKYRAKHGGPPNPLCLARTLDENLVKKRMEAISRRRTGQTTPDLPGLFSPHNEPQGSLR